MIGQTILLAALLGADAGAGAASPAPLGSADPSAWLLGHWTASGFLTAELEPEAYSPHEWKTRRPDTLRLTFTADGGKVKGVLDATNGKKKARVEMVIDLHADDPLVWRENTWRYRFRLQQPPEERYLRFADMRGPTKQRLSYPLVIELEIRDGKLLLSRYRGPQHGALASAAYQFERAP